MTTEEQLAIAIETLRRLADKENMAAATESMSRYFGSAGAGMAYNDVQKYAAETLEKMGIPPLASQESLRLAVERCGALKSGGRCVLLVGHTEDHQNGGTTWRDPLPRSMCQDCLCGRPCVDHDRPTE